jgi:Zn-dependent peptidase ImmA (M78 family)
LIILTNKAVALPNVAVALEWEANEFGGRLLVPMDHLKADFDLFVSGVQKEHPSWWTNLTLREVLTKQLCEKYAVHESVISCRLDKEELWPSI